MEDHSNLTEPYLLNTAGKETIILNQPKFTVGRGLNNSYVVEDIQISRTHCVFEEINGIWCLTDQSANGTFINENRVPREMPQILTNGDTIKLTSNLEYVFINKNNDGFENIDLPGIIDEVEVTTSNINDMNDACGNTIVASSAIPSTSTEDVMSENRNNEHPYSIVNIENIDHTSETTNVSVAANVDIACTSDADICQQPQLENRLNEVQPSNNDGLEQVEDELQCAICTELFIKSTTLNCSHSFCKYCIEEWRKKSKKCPICRSNIITAIPTIVLDNCIAKVISSASDDVRKRREELIKSREKPETVPPIIIKAGKVLRTRNVDPIEISSEEDTSYTDDDDDDLDLDDDENYNGVSGVYYGGYGRCYSCGERGHWSNGCPYR